MFVVDLLNGITADLKTPAAQIGWGLVGFLAVEVLSFARAPELKDGKWPSSLTWPYVVAKIAFAPFAAVVPIILSSPNALNAITVAATAPIFYDRLQKGAKA